MIIGYANTHIENLCIDPEKFGRKEKLPKKIIEVLKNVLTFMNGMDSCQDFFLSVYKKYRFEKFKNEKGLMSIRLDYKYRMTFYDINYDKNKEYNQIVGIEIQEVSNHYGD